MNKRSLLAKIISSLEFQVHPNAEAAAPFLTLDGDRKLSLFPALSLASNKLVLDATLAASIDEYSVTAEQACPLEKWVHVGCEVSWHCFFFTVYLLL